MHDYRAVEVLIERLLELEEPVGEVRIRIGVDLSPESLQQAYEMLTRDTRLAGSRLVVEERFDVRRCASCDEPWHVTREDVLGHMIVCPWCGSASPLGGETSLKVLGVSTRV